MWREAGERSDTALPTQQPLSTVDAKWGPAATHCQASWRTHTPTLSPPLLGVGVEIRSALTEWGAVVDELGQSG